MGACSEIWTSTQFFVSMLQTSNLAVLLILFCSFHLSRIVPSIRFKAGSVTWSTVCLRSSIYSEEVTTHVHGSRVRSLKSDIFNNFRISQFHNHAQSLKSLNSNMAGTMEDFSITGLVSTTAHAGGQVQFTLTWCICRSCCCCTRRGVLRSCSSSRSFFSSAVFSAEGLSLAGLPLAGWRSIAWSWSDEKFEK